jgi:hypothetical protein
VGAGRSVRLGKRRDCGASGERNLVPRRLTNSLVRSEAETPSAPAAALGFLTDVWREQGRFPLFPPQCHWNPPLPANLGVSSRLGSFLRQLGIGHAISKIWKSALHPVFVVLLFSPLTGLRCRAGHGQSIGVPHGKNLKRLRRRRQDPRALSQVPGAQKTAESRRQRD